MSAFNIRRIRTTLTSVLARDKTSDYLPFFGRYAYQAMVGGARLAPMFPFYALLALALSDYEGLRQLLSTTTNSEMSRAVIMLILGGFAIGATVQVLVYAGAPVRGCQGVVAPNFERTETEKWYWAQLPYGEELAVREATTERCSPHIDVRWAMGDLVKELNRSENRTGSDFLDHKVMKLLNIQVPGLKPTQRLDDARYLLTLRYGGVPSSLEWDAKTDELSPGPKAFIVVRGATKAGATEPLPWQRCVVTEGPSEALAVTIAIITRETWTYKSQV